MKNNTVVKITRGASSKIDKLGIVTNIAGIGANQGKVEVEIAGMGKSWYDRTHLEIVEFKTKVGDRVEITYVPGAITNVLLEQAGVVVEAPAIKANSIEVGVKLDDGQTIKWLESNLIVIESTVDGGQKLETETLELSNSVSSASKLPSYIDLIIRDGKTFALVKDLKKHPLNDLIYDDHNIEKLLAEIKASGWVEALMITPDGKTISGNSRLECCKQLAIAEVEVRVREFKDEIEEIDAFLLANSYRIKTNEELIREGLLREEVEAKKAAKREKAGVKIQHREVNWPHGSQNNQNKRHPQSRDIVAEAIGISPRTYSRGKKVIQAIDELKSNSRTGAAKSLKKSLNNKSVYSAYNQLADLRKINNAIASYQENNQLDRAEDLKLLLDNHSITEATIELESYVRDDRKTEANFQHLDIVRIKSKEHQGEWAILDVYDEDKLSAEVLTVTGEIQVLLVNLEKIELSEEQKQYARQLMPRLQAASYNLQGKGEPYAYQTIQYILKKPIPELSALEEKFLQNIEDLAMDSKSSEQMANISSSEEKEVINKIDSKLALNNFISSLEYTGLDRIRAVARSIANNKADAPYLRSPQICRAHQAGEVIVEAAIALVDNEEQLIPILEAYKLKYPNAIQQLCCNKLNQSSNVSDDSNPEGKVIQFENYFNTDTKDRENINNA